MSCWFEMAVWHILLLPHSTIIFARVNFTFTQNTNGWQHPKCAYVHYTRQKAWHQSFSIWAYLQNSWERLVGWKWLFGTCCFCLIPRFFSWWNQSQLATHRCSRLLYIQYVYNMTHTASINWWLSYVCKNISRGPVGSTIKVNHILYLIQPFINMNGRTIFFHNCSFGLLREN